MANLPYVADYSTDRSRHACTAQEIIQESASAYREHALSQTHDDGFFIADENFQLLCLLGVARFLYSRVSIASRQNARQKLCDVGSNLI